MPLDQRCHIESHEIPRDKKLVFFTPVVSHSLEQHSSDSKIWHGSTSIFEGDYPGESHRPPTSLFLPPTSREDLRLNEYLECPHAALTITNIHAFSLIGTQVLQHGRQRH
ncbi:hypothetical protein TNCV_1430141 [Trichonephila clavipes]|nr:hypothetical protein TNCV_1430141 [Trichonephila clavipes]